MSVWEAIVLGTLQGLTEFLPVSSSGHIEIAREVLGVRMGDNMQFTMMLHAGTVFSTIVVFRREIGKLLADLFKFRLNEGTLFIINLLIASLPIAFVGLMFRDRIESLFSGNLLLVGCMLLATAALLILSGRMGKKNKPPHPNGGNAEDNGKPMTPVRAFVVGIAQAVAVLPGLSRSGSTISAGLLQGVGRATVAKFSFLMALIPIMGELLLDAGEMKSTFTAPMLAGFLASFAVGCLACRWMVRLVSRGRLVWFAVYCCALGIAAIIFSTVSNSIPL
jgi:undecaprenyl-diphosphatase